MANRAISLRCRIWSLSGHEARRSIKGTDVRARGELMPAPWVPENQYGADAQYQRFLAGGE
jgi:hypothetical protein